MSEKVNKPGISPEEKLALAKEKAAQLYNPPQKWEQIIADIKTASDLFQIQRGSRRLTIIFGQDQKRVVYDKRGRLKEVSDNRTFLEKLIYHKTSGYPDRKIIFRFNLGENITYYYQVDPFNNTYLEKMVIKTFKVLPGFGRGRPIGKPITEIFYQPPKPSKKSIIGILWPEG